MNDHFQDFIQAGLARSVPQWLLLVFLYVEHHEDKGLGRTMSLAPLMMTHQRLLHALSFDALVAEADHLDDRWEFLLLGCMDDAPEATVCKRLREIAHQLASGADLSDFLIFDRQQHPIVI
ncbi:MAG: hypothetical protein J5I81_14475 [Nitrococcus mobilis]|nr:hypothetical protein [Nitrococcus mobilis]